MLSLVALLVTPAWVLQSGAKPELLKSAATLCVDEFELAQLPFPVMQRRGTIEKWVASRAALLAAPQEHALLVAMGKPTAPDNGVVGVVEIGMLPPPPKPNKREPPVPGAIAGDILVPYIANLAVASSERGAGLGRKLVEAAEETARAWGCDCMYCKVDRANFGARRLYDRLGYELVYLQPRRAGSGWSNIEGAWLFLGKTGLLTKGGADGASVSECGSLGNSGG